VVGQNIVDDVIDFGFSATVFDADVLAANPDLLAIPVASLMIVPVVNLPELNSTDNLILSLPVMAGIMSGNITRWNAPEILALNPQVASKLPSANITVIVQESEQEGNQFLTDSLSKAE